jgi:ABC-2 type transport system ATP-binding protein
MINVERVTKRFGSVLALDAVSVAVAPGERVALVGTNGSGKTTLLRALCGLLRVEGRIQIGGVDLAERPEVALRALAYMPQTTPPLEAPVGELVRAYCGLRGCSSARVEECAALLGLALGAVARTRTRDLSGGMKQKLLAALALASEAPLLVCDEPTASLDARARSSFIQLIQARPAASSLLLCSHRLDEVRELVDRVVELEDGRIARDEPISSSGAHARARPMVRRVSGCL